MKSRLEFLWFNFVALFRWYRIVGIGSLSLIAYLLVVRFDKTDVSWMLPQSPFVFHWPNLPTFSVRQEVSKDGRTQETYYTVPTRQFTAKELAELPQTKQPAK